PRIQNVAFRRVGGDGPTRQHWHQQKHDASDGNRLKRSGNERHPFTHVSTSTPLASRAIASRDARRHDRAGDPWNHMATRRTSLFSYFFRPRNRLTLNGPAPCVAMYRKTKQKVTASSPPLRIRSGPRGAVATK